MAGLTCSSCHTPPPGPGSDRLIISGTALQESQDFKVPHLRNIYQKLDFNNAAGASSVGGFGLTHDGALPTLQAFLSQPVFVNIRSNTTIKNNLAAFVQCFDTGAAPAIGYTRTVTATNVSSAGISNDWSLLESQAAVTNIDLIAKGTLDGQWHGLLYQPSLTNYLPDTTNLAPLTRVQLVAKIQNGDTLSFMGVPPGSGARMGIDRDENGVLDADEPPPVMQIAAAGGNVVVHWPLSAAGFALQSSTDLASGVWTNRNDPVAILAGQNYVTNPPLDSARIYRLRFPFP